MTTTNFLKTGYIRISPLQLVAPVLCAASAMTACVGLAWADNTQSSPASLVAALELCSSRTMLKGEVDIALSSAGWVVQDKPDFDGATSFSDFEPLQVAMFSTHFASSFDPSSSERMHYSLGNSVFMMGSILGNSAIRKIPPVYQTEALTLLLVARELEKPYCVLTGGTDLATEVLTTEGVAGTTIGSQDMPPLRSHRTATYNDAEFQIFALSLPQVRETILDLTATPAKEAFLPAETYPALINLIQSTNIIITPSQ